MKIIFSFILFIFLGCSSLINGVASVATSVAVFAITIPIKVIYSVGKSALNAASSNSNSNDTKIAKKALEQKNFKKAYEYYARACNDDEPMVCALGNYAYTKCELLNDGCKINTIINNNAIKYFSAKLFLDEAKELSEENKKAYVNIACSYDNSISKDCK